MKNSFLEIIWGSLTPLFVWMNILIRVELELELESEFPDFPGHMEVPYKFIVGLSSQTNTHFHSSLSWVELNWVELRVDQLFPGFLRAIPYIVQEGPAPVCEAARFGWGWLWLLLWLLLWGESKVPPYFVGFAQ